MSILHLKFTPHIAFFELPVEGQFGLSQIADKIYPTDNQELNQLILPGLINDRIKFITVFGGSIIDSIPVRYEFSDNLIHVWVRERDGNSIMPEDLSQELDLINPNGGGPDGWMSRNITIVDEDIAKKFGYGAIELHPYISYVGVSVTQSTTEYEVDRSKLPPP